MSKTNKGLNKNNLFFQETENMYARNLTKQDLIRDGITCVTYDGRVFRGDDEVKASINNSGYLVHNLFARDENGERIKVPCASSVFGYVYKVRTVGLHRLMWAWFHNEVPNGMVVDHISNKHEHMEDYKLDNLQLLTPSENIRKDRPESTVELRCKMDRPRSYYENKLEQLLAEYEKTKLKNSPDHVHKLRSKIYQTRARLRFWDSHKEEIEQNIALKEAGTKDKALKAQKQARVSALRSLATKAKAMNNYSQWHQFLNVIKNYDSFTEEQLDQIIKKNEAKYRTK